MTRWSLDVERVRVAGATCEGVGTAELRALVDVAVRNALATVPLPTGGAMRTSVRVTAPTLANGAAIASAVASGVAQAAGGRARG